jgi:hypothetical protein
MTQNNLGIALKDLGEQSEGAQATAYLQQSVDAYRSALEVYTREQPPQDWAGTQNNLGNVLSDLGERSEGAQATAYLKQSVAAYRICPGLLSVAPAIRFSALPILDLNRYKPI